MRRAGPFRYMTDGIINHTGFWVDNVTAGDTLISDGSTLAGWQTVGELRPIPIAGASLRLVAYDADHERARVTDVPLDGDNDGELTASQMSALRGTDADTLIAVVNHYEPTETIVTSAPYAPNVNGVLQSGGGTEAP